MANTIDLGVVASVRSSFPVRSDSRVALGMGGERNQNSCGSSVSEATVQQGESNEMPLRLTSRGQQPLQVTADVEIRCTQLGDQLIKAALTTLRICLELHYKANFSYLQVFK